MPFEERYQRAMQATVRGLLINGLLAVVKLVAGVLGNSYALIADAIESMSDIFASAVVWTGLRVAQRPADADHPYGHGKAEALAALAVSIMLVGASIGITIEAIREILIPHHAPAAFTLWVLGAVVLCKELLFRFMHGVAERESSDAVKVDAWHHRSDALTSLAAAIGISIALLGGRGYEAADDWAAIFAAIVILWNAVHLMRAPMHELMDTSSGAFDDRIRQVAANVSGVAGVEKLIVRKSGMRFWADMHLEVDPHMPVHRAHAISHDVKDAILAAIPEIGDVLIHIEPAGTVHGAMAERPNAANAQGAARAGSGERSATEV